MLRSPMRSWHRRRRLLLAGDTGRAYSTSYTARVVHSGEDGRTISAEVTPPSDLEVDPRGHPLPRQHLVCRIANILRSQFPTSDPYLELSDYLATLPHPSLTPADVSEVLKSLQTPEMALPFFRYAADSLPGYRHDCFSYNRILLILANAGAGTARVCRVVAEMDRTRVEQAYKVLQEMKRRHCQPDAYTYSILIRMTGKLGKPVEFLSFFAEMVAKGCIPNLVVYNTMIQALGKNGLVDKMILIFSEMVVNNWRPNEFTYSAILRALAAENQVHRIHEVVAAAGKYMSKPVYVNLMKKLGKMGHAAEAHKLFCDLWVCEGKGDRYAIMSMLENLCGAGKTQEAMDLLSKIPEKGLEADTFMYNLVFTTLSKLRQTSKSVSLFKKMKEDGVLPDVFTYNILISSFSRARLVDEALKIFEEMEGNNCKPDVVSYNSLINCLRKNGDVDSAHMRFKEMQENGLNPDVFTYSTLIECFGKSNRVEMACMLLDEMLDRGCFPNIVTYNILLDCLENCGKTSEALKLYDKLKEQGITPDSITYDILERLQSGYRKAIRTQNPRSITGWVVSPLSLCI